MVAGVSGLSGLDAITLSTARLVNEVRMSPQEGWILLILAVVTNMLAKCGIIVLFGHPRLFRLMVVLLFFPIIVGMLLLMFWPSDLQLSV